MLESEFFKQYNYYIHPQISSNNNSLTDEELIKEVQKKGISMVYFCKHLDNPNPIILSYNYEKENFDLINQLKEKYTTPIILTGFESEYNPIHELYLSKMSSKVDCMILKQTSVNRGMQTVPPENNPNYPLEFAYMVCKAIDSGIYDIVTCPDYFIKYRDTITSDEGKQIFDENTVIASQIICEKAKDMGIPIEINASSLPENQDLSNDYLSHYIPFWKVANEIDGLNVLIGTDADKNQKEIEDVFTNEMGKIVEDKLIIEHYNAKEKRMNNKKLEAARMNSKNNALTLETFVINQILNNALTGFDDNLDAEVIANIIRSSLNNTLDYYVKVFVEEAQKDKKKEKRKERALVFTHQSDVINTAISNVETAFEIGCVTKQEYINIITQLTQYSTAKNTEQKNKIKENIFNFAKNKNLNLDETYQLERKNAIFNSRYGYMNIFVLIIVIVIIIGIGIVIGNIIYKI